MCAVFKDHFMQEFFRSSVRRRLVNFIGISFEATAEDVDILRSYFVVRKRYIDIRGSVKLYISAYHLVHLVSSNADQSESVLRVPISHSETVNMGLEICFLYIRMTSVDFKSSSPAISLLLSSAFLH